MSILNPTTNAAQFAADQVRTIIRNQYTQLSRSGVQGFNLIWHNANAEPQDILTELSTDAANVFQLAALNISTLQAAAMITGTQPPSIPNLPDGIAISFNQDGTAVMSSTVSTTSSVANQETKAA